MKDKDKMSTINSISNIKSKEKKNKTQRQEDYCY